METQSGVRCSLGVRCSRCSSAVAGQSSRQLSHLPDSISPAAPDIPGADGSALWPHSRLPQSLPPASSRPQAFAGTGEVGTWAVSLRMLAGVRQMIWEAGQDVRCRGDERNPGNLSAARRLSRKPRRSRPNDPKPLRHASFRLVISSGLKTRERVQARQTKMQNTRRQGQLANGC